MAQWVRNNNLQSKFSHLITDMENVATDSGTNAASIVQGDCQSVKSDVDNLENVPAAPDLQLADDIRTMLTNFRGAAVACLSVTNDAETGDQEAESREQSAMQHYTSLGQAALDQATQRMKDLG